MNSKKVPVFIAALLCCCHIDSFFMVNDAEIIPNDALAFIGQRLILQCLLQDGSGISPSALRFQIATSENKTFNIPPEETKILQNSITAEIEITRQFNSYPTVLCFTQKNLLNSAGIYVEYPIKNITNFTGTLYFDNSTIILTWSQGESYLDMRFISVIVDWNPNSSPGSNSSRCTNQSKEFCSISWGFQDIIFIRVNVSFTRHGDLSQSHIVGPPYKTSAISIHEFRPLDNLKAGPPKFLTVEKVNNTCVWISWENSPYFSANPNSSLIYWITVKAENGSELNVTLDHEERQNSSVHGLVCQLVPFTKYSMSVQIKAKDINPWSDSAIVGFETEEDQPLTGPTITDTSYLVGKCIDNKRDVTVYWKDPSKQSLQGRLTMFNVTSNDKQWKLLRPAYNYYTDSIDCNSSSKIEVYSVTKVGPSLVPSQMNIPKESDELTFEKDLMFRVEENSVLDDGRSTINFTIKWDPGDHVRNMQLIVYMCQETYIPNTCFNDFETIEANISDKEIHLPEQMQSTNLFGYAVKNDFGRKSGIHWTSCVYRTDTKPDIPTGVYVSPGSQANSLEISWKSTQCDRSKKVLILRYYLWICKQRLDPCVDMTCCLSVTISDFSKNNYTAKKLEGGQPYNVYMQAESMGGLSPRLKVAVETPRIANSETQNIVGITMGTVLGVLFVGLVLFCCIRHCRKSKKSFEELKKKAEINLPKTARQDSFDSGAYTGSNPNSSNGSRPIPPSPPVDVHSLQLSTQTDSSTASSFIKVHCGVEGADAGTHTHVSPLVGDEADSSVPNMQSGNINTEGRDARGASVSTQAACVGAGEDAPSSAVIDTNSNPYMRVGNINLAFQPSHVTHSDVDNVSMESSNVSNPFVGEISNIPSVIQHVPMLELVAFHTDQQTTPREVGKRQTAEQATPKEVDKRQTAEQTAPKGEDYVRYCTDGDVNCQMEHYRPDSDPTIARDISPLTRQPLPDDTNQDQDTTCSSVDETEIKHNRVHSTVPQQMLLLSEPQVGHSSKCENAAGFNAEEDCLSNIATGRTVPLNNVQLSCYQALPQDSNQGMTVASSNPESYDDYIRQTDASTDDTGEDEEKDSVRGTHMCRREKTDSPDNYSLFSFGSNCSINSSNGSLTQNNFSIDNFISNRFMNDGRNNFNMQSGDNSQVTVNESLEKLGRQDMITELRNGPGGQDSVNVGEVPPVSNCDHQGASAGYDPQASFEASQNDSFDDEDSDESSADVELGRRQQRDSSMGGSGYVPVPCVNTFSCSEESDVSYNGSATC